MEWALKREISYFFQELMFSGTPPSLAYNAAASQWSVSFSSMTSFCFFSRPIYTKIIFFSRILRMNNLTFHDAEHLIFSLFFSFAWKTLWCLSLHVYVSIEDTTLIQRQHVTIFFFLLNLFPYLQQTYPIFHSFRDEHILAKADTFFPFHS